MSNLDDKFLVEVFEEINDIQSITKLRLFIENYDYISERNRNVLQNQLNEKSVFPLTEFFSFYFTEILDGSYHNLNQHNTDQDTLDIFDIFLPQLGAVVHLLVKIDDFIDNKSNSEIEIIYYLSLQKCSKVLYLIRHLLSYEERTFYFNLFYPCLDSIKNLSSWENRDDVIFEIENAHEKINMLTSLGEIKGYLQKLNRYM